MKTLTAKILGVSLAMALFLVAPLAHGQSTYTDPAQNYMNVNDSVTGSGGAGYTLVFQKFNTALGTLTSVQVIISNVYVSGTATVTNDDPMNAHSYSNVFLQGDYTVSGGGASVETLLTSPTFSSGPVTPLGHYTTPTTANGTAGGSSTTYTDSTTLMNYSGVGVTTISLALSSDNAAGAFGPGTHTESEMSQGSGTVDIIYTYTPVPEPRQTAFLMLGLTMVALAARKYLSRTPAFSRIA